VSVSGFLWYFKTTDQANTKQTRETVQKQKNCRVFQSQQAARGPKNGRGQHYAKAMSSEFIKPMA
jgi:hypothetical protein